MILGSGGERGFAALVLIPAAYGAVLISRNQSTAEG